MLLAEQRPVSFVINQDGPTDLRSVGTDPAWDPNTQEYDQTNGPQQVYNWAVAAFGVSGLAAMSPSVNASHIAARVLQAPTSIDELVGSDQWGALGTGWVDVLSGPGPIAWTHGSVSTPAYQGYLWVVGQLLRGL
jgi:hypothetical protein